MATAWRRVLGATQAMLRRLKAPWQITGPASSPEFKDSMPDMLSYRIFSPATPANHPSIPHSDSDHVYDIKYFVRDRRRATPPKKVEVQDLKAQTHDPALEHLQPSPSIYVMGRQVPITEIKNEGYQK